MYGNIDKAAVFLLSAPPDTSLVAGVLEVTQALSNAEAWLDRRDNCLHLDCKQTSCESTSAIVDLHDPLA